MEGAATGGPPVIASVTRRKPKAAPRRATTYPGYVLCEVCVYDVYVEQLEAYEQALAAWKARHPEAGD